MPTYPVINKKTGETDELHMTMREYDQWRLKNPDWGKDGLKVALVSEKSETGVTK